MSSAEPHVYNDMAGGLQSIKLESEQGRQSLHCQERDSVV